METWEYHWQQITKFLGQSLLQYFPLYTIQGLQHWLLAEEDPKTLKRIVEEEWQQMPYKLLCSSIPLQLASNPSNGRNYGTRSLPCWVLIPVQIKVWTNQRPKIFSVSSIARLRQYGKLLKVCLRQYGKLLKVCLPCPISHHRQQSWQFRTILGWWNRKDNLGNPNQVLLVRPTTDTYPEEVSSRGPSVHCRYVQYVARGGCMPLSQRHVIVTPHLKKAGADQSDVKNCRPISYLTFM